MPNIWGITPTSTPNIISGALYEREHQGQIGVRSGSDDDSDDYDDDAYTDTKAVFQFSAGVRGGENRGFEGPGSDFEAKVSQMVIFAL